MSEGSGRERRVAQDMAPGELALTRSAPAPQGGALDRRAAKAVVALDATDATQAQRSLVAGLARVPDSHLDELARSGQPWVLSGHGSAGAAQDSVRSLALPGTADVLTAPSLALAGGLAMALMFTGFVASLVTAYFLWWAGLALLGLSALAMLLPVGVYALRRQRFHALAASVFVPDGSPQWQAVWNRLSAQRVTLARSDLPEVAQADLRGELAAIEAVLLELAGRSATAVELAPVEAALGEVDELLNDAASTSSDGAMAKVVSTIKASRAALQHTRKSLQG